MAIGEEYCLHFVAIAGLREENRPPAVSEARPAGHRRKHLGCCHPRRPRRLCTDQPALCPHRDREAARRDYILTPEDPLHPPGQFTF